MALPFPLLFLLLSSFTSSFGHFGRLGPSQIDGEKLQRENKEREKQEGDENKERDLRWKWSWNKVRSGDEEEVLKEQREQKLHTHEGLLKKEGIKMSGLDPRYKGTQLSTVQGHVLGLCPRVISPVSSP